MKRIGAVAAVLLAVLAVSVLLLTHWTAWGRWVGRETRLATTAVRSATQSIYPEPALTLEMWRGGRVAAFRVELFESGRLVAYGAHKSEQQLKNGGTKLILDLASRAAHSDFNVQGCETATDGLNARISLLHDGRMMRVTCRNAARWPRGPATRQLLAEIRNHLPDDLKHTMDVLSGAKWIAP
jgi:hypothetical protein